MVVLKQLRNFVCLLGENAHVIINSEGHWMYFEMMLMKLLEVDPQGIRIVDLSVSYPDYSSVSVSNTNGEDILKADLMSTPAAHMNGAFRDLKFRHIDQRGMLQIILDIVNVLGYVGNVDALVNAFMERFLASNGKKVQALIIVNDLLWGAKGHVSVRAKNLCSSGKQNPEPLVVDTAEEVLHTLIESPLFRDSTGLLNWHTEMQLVEEMEWYECDLPPTNYSTIKHCSTISTMRPTSNRVRRYENGEKVAPLYVRSCKLVTEACIQNLGSPVPKVRVELLRTVCTGLHVLNSHEEELLPLVHKTWWHLEKRLLRDTYHAKAWYSVNRYTEGVAGVYLVAHEPAGRTEFVLLKTRPQGVFLDNL
eukprot:sb/3465945/